MSSMQMCANDQNNERRLLVLHCPLCDLATPTTSIDQLYFVLIIDQPLGLCDWDLMCHLLVKSSHVSLILSVKLGSLTSRTVSRNLKSFFSLLVECVSVHVSPALAEALNF